MLVANGKRSQAIAAALDQRRLNLILFPTEKCNFRCSYCYEDFKLGRMHPDVVDGVKKLLSRRMPELEYLELSWFGGEPLLAPDIIESISLHILDFSKRHPSFRYSANITTNAFFLTEERYSWLHRLGVRNFQVSLDGDRDDHNATRVALNGSATFDTIWENLRSIHLKSTEPARIILRVHFMPSNFDRLVPLIERINQEFSNDDRFVVYFKSIERLGSQNDEALDVFSMEAASLVKKHLYGRLANQRMAYDIGADGDYICYATKANSFGVRADGALVKCTVALYDNRNHVGRLSADGTVEINRNALMLWLNGLETMDSLALACPFSLMRPESDNKCNSVSYDFLHT